MLSGSPVDEVGTGSDAARSGVLASSTADAGAISNTDRQKHNQMQMIIIRAESALPWDHPGQQDASALALHKA